MRALLDQGAFSSRRSVVMEVGALTSPCCEDSIHFATTVLQTPPRIAGRTPPVLSVVHAGSPSTLASPEQLTRGRALVDEIVRLRVGGCFWGDRPATCPVGTTVIRVRTVADAVAPHRRPEFGATVLLVPRDLVDAFAPDGRFKSETILVDPIDPWHLIDRAGRIVAHPDDPLAVLARFAGKIVLDVRDGHVMSADRDLIAAAASHRLIHDTRYIDPFDGNEATAEEMVALLGEWRHWLDQNRQIAVMTGVRGWKRERMGTFLDGPGAAPLNVDDPATVVAVAKAAGGGIAAWPSRMAAGLAEMADPEALPVFRVEDGFLRSLGLGSNLVLPQSIVVDARGIHYDARTPSDLEHLLTTTDFTQNLIRRAATLRCTLIESGLGKYGHTPAARTTIPPSGRRCILVVGQVADDLSVQLSGGATSNSELLAAARKLDPDAFIIYKPHPDVLAGHRDGAISSTAAHDHADLVLASPVSLIDLFGVVDTVHTISSLAGFEALLRGRHVVCHGLPFYAGWGLTEDLVAIPRRSRRLSIDELVAGALILYPRYLDPQSGLPCPPEILVQRLRAARPTPTMLTRLRVVQGRMRRLGARVVGA